MLVTPIRLLVGLGNPGSRYEETRHNAGAWWLNLCAEKFHARLTENSRFRGLIGEFSYQNEKRWLLFPTTFMNLSGEAVQLVMKFYKISPAEVLVAHDELDLPLAHLRLKFAGGHGGHNGLRSMTTCLNSSDYLRLRIGIGRPLPGTVAPVDYVLMKPPRDEREKIASALSNSLDMLPHLFAGERDKALQIVNTIKN